MRRDALTNVNGISDEEQHRKREDKRRYTRKKMGRKKNPPRRSSDKLESACHHRYHLHTRKNPNTTRLPFPSRRNESTLKGKNVVFRMAQCDDKITSWLSFFVQRETILLNSCSVLTGGSRYCGGSGRGRERCGRCGPWARIRANDGVRVLLNFPHYRPISARASACQSWV